MLKILVWLIFFVAPVLVILFDVFSRDRMKYAIALFLVLIPFHAVFKFYLGSFVLRAWSLAYVILLFLIIFLRTAVRGDHKFRINKLDFVVLLFVGYGFFQIFNSYFQIPFLLNALDSFRVYFFAGLFYFCVRYFVKKPEDVVFVCRILLFTIFLVSLEAILEFVLLNSRIISAKQLFWFSSLLSETQNTMHGWVTSSGGQRILGVFSSPHAVGFFVLSGVLLLFPFHFIYKIKLKSDFLFSLYCFGVLIFAFLFAMTGTAIGAAMLAILLAVICLRKFDIKFVLYPLLAALPLLFYNLNFTLRRLVFVLYESPYWEHLLVAIYITTTRLTSFWSVCFGVGALAQENILNIIGEDIYRYSTSFMGGDYAFLKLFSAFGILYLILFMMMVVVAVRLAFKVKNNISSPFYQSLLVGFGLAVFALPISLSHYSSIFKIGVFEYFFTMLALISAMYNITRKESI